MTDDDPTIGERGQHEPICGGVARTAKECIRHRPMEVNARRTWPRDGEGSLVVGATGDPNDVFAGGCCDEGLNVNRYEDSFVARQTFVPRRHGCEVDFGGR